MVKNKVYLVWNIFTISLKDARTLHKDGAYDGRRQSVLDVAGCSSGKETAACSGLGRHGRLKHGRDDVGGHSFDLRLLCLFQGQKGLMPLPKLLVRHQSALSN